MSDLIPSVMQLNRGLDLTSAKITAEVGSLFSCVNYDITDSEGLHRVDGYEPYDGQVSPSNVFLYRVVLSAIGALSVGDLIVAADGVFKSGSSTTVSYTTDTIIGKVVEIDSGTNSFLMSVINLDVLGTDAGLGYVNQTTGAVTSLGTVTSITTAQDFYTTEPTLFTALTNAQSNLRGDILVLGYPAAGLHRFRDKSYAIAPLPELLVRGQTVIDGFSSGTYTLTPTAGNVITNSLNSAVALVISTRTTNISGFIRYYWTIAPLSGSYQDWQDAIDGSALITGITIVAGTAPITKARAFSIGVGLFSETKGTLWSSQSEQLALESGATPFELGWRPQATNFVTTFNNGVYATATIPKSERSFSTVPATATYYLTDGANIFSCELMSYFVDEVSGGSFVAGTATGDLQIRNVQLISGVWDTIDSTYDLHSANPPTAPNKVADITSTLAYNSLALNTALIEAKSRYQVINANFYADESWDAMYGVNGVNRAWYYTGTFFATIFTQNTDAADIPRHIGYHHQHLALGYRSGSALLSVIGEPHNFLGSDGASEHSVGDRINGLLSLNGTSLGIFCEQSIWQISGTTVDNFQTGVISPNTGCLEYTLADIGHPVFCNGSGIRSLEQSEKYGDFVGKPLSYKVNPWLRPRLRRISGRNASAGAVIAALPVRHKNQYRLYFKDGACLTMTLVDEQEPQFTTQYPLVSATSDPFTPFALCSQMDEDGEEHLLASYYDTRSGEYSEHVYELDKGFGWAGLPIEHYFETNFFYGESPSQFIQISKARLYGLTHGRSSLKIAVSGPQTQQTQRYHTQTELIDMPNTAEEFSVLPVFRNSKPASLANRGLSLQLKISNRQSAVAEPSHICQVLVLAMQPGGASDI